jgi:hypothetical protein
MTEKRVSKIVTLLLVKMHHRLRCRALAVLVLVMRNVRMRWRERPHHLSQCHHQQTTCWNNVKATMKASMKEVAGALEGVRARLVTALSAWLLWFAPPPAPCRNRESVHTLLLGLPINHGMVRRRGSVVRTGMKPPLLCSFMVKLRCLTRSSLLKKKIVKMEEEEGAKRKRRDRNRRRKLE